MYRLSEQQIAFFDTFGFLQLPGALRADIAWITQEFEAVFPQMGLQHDGTQRTCVVPFVDQRERLCTLLDHPVVEGAAASLLGDDFQYLAGDGNYYSGDTQWHSDGFHTVGKYLKIAFYLDPVTRDTGALRVIPGSHNIPWRAASEVGSAGRAQELWGIAQSEVPAVALESQPGDVVLFNHNLMHAAFGGSNKRRMFTLNMCSHADTPEEIEEMKEFISSAARFWLDSLHSQTMRSTASPARWKHLEQVAANEGHLPALSAQARATMSERARG